MTVVMNMRWDGVTPEQYDAARDEVKWEIDAPDGAISHVAWFEDGAIRVIDVWESGEQFQTFVEQRLMPGTAKVGIAGQPDVTIQPAHRYFDAVHGDTRS
jgi:hypothetical protein